MCLSVRCRIALHPLGEFVDGDQEVSHATAGLLQRPDHVQPPDRKRPGERDGHQCSRWQVRLMGELLAPFVAVNDVDCVSLHGQPEDVVAMSFGGDGSPASMVPAVARMDVMEDAATFLRGDASEETSRGGALVELVVDDGVALGVPLNLPRQHLVSRQRAELEVCDVRLGPVWSCM